MTRSRSAAAVAVVLAVLALGSCSSASHPEVFRGIQIDPPRDVSKVELPEATAGNAPFRFRAQPGHLLLLYFGYTNCPDICPTTLADLRQARRDPKLADIAPRIDLAMATIDPTRDTAQLLSSYLRSFDPRGHALRTTDQTQLRAATDAVGASYNVKAGSKPGEEEVSHTAFVYAINDQGRVVAQWSFPTAPADYVNDLPLLPSGKPLPAMSS